MVGIRPGHHDLVDTHIRSNSEILRRPDGRPTAVTSRLNAAAHIPNVPGHIVRRHRLGGRLRNGIDDGVLDQRRVAKGHPQRVHGEDQFVCADTARRGCARPRGIGARRSCRAQEPGQEEQNEVRQDFCSSQNNSS